MRQSSGKRPPSHALWHSVKVTQSIENPAVLSSSVGGLFPPGVPAAEMRAPGNPALLYPQESAHLGTRAVPKRVQEFAAGRLCARKALAELGVRNFPVEVASDRQPVWPPGVVGSITHTEGFCAAVAADKKILSAVGLDSELAGSVKHELWRNLFRGSEVPWLNSLPPSQQAAAATMLFSAKEAFYKCQYPLTREWLNFHDVWVEVPAWGAGQGVFNIHANRGIAFERHAALPLQGRFILHDSFVTAGVGLPAV
jgi:4'-phosphopantetheinyl transferase EntD